MLADSNYSTDALMSTDQIFLRLLSYATILDPQVGVANTRMRDVDKNLTWKEVLRLDDGMIREERSRPADLRKEKGLLRLGNGELGGHGAASLSE